MQLASLRRGKIKILERELELIDIRPEFAGDIDKTRSRVVRDPVQHFRGGVFVTRFTDKGIQVEPSDNLTGSGVDFEDIIRLPLVGVQITADQFELIDISVR